MKRWFAALMIALLLASGTEAAPASANDAYNYSYWGTRSRPPILTPWSG